MLVSAKTLSIFFIIRLWMFPEANLMAQDTLRVIYYNILNYTGSTTERCY